MAEQAEMDEAGARMLHPGEGERLEARGSVMLFKATSALTKGRLSIMERSLPPGGRMPPPHRHTDREEAYFVLQGEVSFRLAGELSRGRPGDFVLVPGGVAHTFGNQAREPARLLVLHAPGLDQYFRELERLWAAAEPPTREEELRLMARHGMEPA